MGEELESKVRKPGFLKKAALVAGASALFFLVGCAQELIQYRARVQTKPQVEVSIFMNKKYKGRTSKKEAVYVESEPLSKDSQCTLSLRRNKYNASFIMNYLNDIKGIEFEKIVTLNPEGKSENCEEARITTWEKGPSYDLLFKVPSKMIFEVFKPEKKYTEWGDEIKEEPKVIPKKEEPYKKSEPIKPIPKKTASNYKSEKTETITPIKTPETDIGKLVDELKPVEFFASVGVGNTFGGLGVAGGVLFNIRKTVSIETSLGLGYMMAGYITTKSSSEFDTVAVEGNAAINLRWGGRFKRWRTYLKGFCGIQGKAIGTTYGNKVEEKLLFGVGLIVGGKWTYDNKYFIFGGSGFRYTFLNEDFGAEFGNILTTDISIELGTGMKF